MLLLLLLLPLLPLLMILVQEKFLFWMYHMAVMMLEWLKI